jgi:NAD(P)-dependent dehydrogenase (short-subunit alcohol dehydrogenase family)
MSTYLITGSTGIGAATARLAARNGAQVFVVSKTDANVAALVDELGTLADGAVADLVDAGDVEAAVAACVARFGRIDGLYNVAGISGRSLGDGPVHVCSEGGWDTTLETNLKSQFLVCRAVLTRMMAQEPDARGLRGAILNMASVLGFAPERDYFATHAYAASKAAILGMTKSMAAYYAPHKIRVNAIAPALIRTPMSQRAQTNPEILARMRTKQPLIEDLIDADDVAQASWFLLNHDTSAAITGDILTVDAGWSVS